jgi:hypothetical protein
LRKRRIFLLKQVGSSRGYFSKQNKNIGRDSGREREVTRLKIELVSA